MMLEIIMGVLVWGVCRCSWFLMRKLWQEMNHRGLLTLTPLLAPSSHHLLTGMVRGSCQWWSAWSWESVGGRDFVRRNKIWIVIGGVFLHKPDRDGRLSSSSASARVWLANWNVLSDSWGEAVFSFSEQNWWFLVWLHLFDSWVSRLAVPFFLQHLH